MYDSNTIRTEVETEFSHFQNKWSFLFSYLVTKNLQRFALSAETGRTPDCIFSNFFAGLDKKVTNRVLYHLFASWLFNECLKPADEN